MGSTLSSARPLHRILGLGFGLAFAFGTMMGVGILRLPGTVAEAAKTPTLIILCWCIGAVYALMGAVSISELAAMYPEAGGFRVYARHAFGDRAGFIVGWIDWLASVATLAYAGVAVVDFAGTLWPPVAQYPGAAAIALIGIFTALHCAGLRMSSAITSAVSATTGILMLALVIGCFVAAPATRPVASTAGGSEHLAGLAALLALVPAVRALLTAYDGYYAPIYTAEESVDSGRTLPRAIIGGALLVAALYLAINVALLHVLPVPVLAASKLPVATAAQIVLPHGSASLMTVLAILIVLGLMNSNCITGSRVLFSLAREGLIVPKAAAVNRGGTPYVALIATTSTSVAMVATGSFNELIALFAVLMLLYYIAAFVAIFVLRLRSPRTPRPYRAFGYPVTTFVVLLGSLGFLAAAIAEDWRSAVTALVFLSLCIPAYAFAARSRRARVAELAAGPNAP